MVKLAATAQIYWVVCAAQFVGASAFAAPAFTYPVCPATISESEALVGTPPTGWTVVKTDAPQWLNSVGFSTVQPNDASTLKGDLVSLNRERDVTYYGLDGPNPNWIFCSYENAAAVLFSKLPASVNSCEIVTSHAGLGNSIEAMSCAPGP